ncbi:hypothetical protein [Saccharothrix algeriensis]|uniref:Uncharacterized protein n=1 Tax=Saccharothrix algeriensis TaxID=173560 RepID=A0A8T8I081_9PSEU|nr:hypothetical protein [Saccharothrix algeriensis]MBM7809881.1 hypothetical protein [Saccharothrix algeriensis]QTR04136.1 hypothetical protein J7S33_03950 [Saccharothrix algeriensis]
MDRTRLGAWLMIALAAAQVLAVLLTGPGGEPAVVAVALNAAAVASAAWLLRRPAHSRWPLTAWAAGFFGWHATGLVTLAGIVPTGLDAVFAIAPHRELSTLHQAVLTTAAAFAVHLLLPRPRRS